MAKRTRSSNKSVMNHRFSQVPSAKIPRSSFDRSHGYKTTFDSGYLVPIFVDEVLPGDTMSLRANMFGRLATPLKPVMDSMFLESFFFFVPNRLVWDNWEKFNGEQDDPGDSIDFSIPLVSGGGAGVATGTLHDYFGLPITIDNERSALPFRGYSLIYNEWFRDQNLQDSTNVAKSDGPDFLASPTTASNQVEYAPFRRGKRHDYFTSSLPWPQKGDPVTVDLGGLAPVGNPVTTDAGNPIYVDRGDGASQYQIDTSANPAEYATAAATTNLFADLSQATGFTINDLRQSFQIQRLLERDARGGTRYTEIIRSHFGVTSPDARLQRPEFLGGGTSMININPIANTSATATEPQGDLAAFGTVSAGGHGFTKSFTEHGHIIGMVNVRADLTYQQGMNRMWSRSTRYDFYWPALSHLGEQAVLSKEIYADGSANDEDVWGYQEAWAEYRYKPSLITGVFRSAAASSLDVWHLSQDFATRPVLSAAFIEDTPPVQRIIAVPGEPEFLLDVYFKYRCARPMPLYGVPGLIDHF